MYIQQMLSKKHLQDLLLYLLSVYILSIKWQQYSESVFSFAVVDET